MDRPLPGSCTTRGHLKRGQFLSVDTELRGRKHQLRADDGDSSTRHRPTSLRRAIGLQLRTPERTTRRFCCVCFEQTARGVATGGQGRDPKTWMLGNQQNIETPFRLRDSLPIDS
jgi:hypothetical protein